MNEPKELTYTGWLQQMKEFKGGYLGGSVIAVTLIATPVLAYYGIDLFPDGNYPRIVLALPGLIGGACVFFGVSRLLWNFKKPE